MKNARSAAVAALVEVETKGGYSNLVLKNLFSESGLSPADRSLAAALFYGVLDRKLTVDYILNRLLKKGIKSIKPFTASVLRISAYQLLFMERIPDSAAVNEAVKLVKGSRESYNAGLVNAVLRNLIRNGADLPEGSDTASLSVRYSCPEWIIESFAEDYGYENALGIIKTSLEEPPVILHVNTLRVSAAELCGILNGEGVNAAEMPEENALSVSGGIDIASLESYKKGLFFVQDLACQRSIAKLQPKAGERVIDLCAAPGGKSLAAALLMKNQGEIKAFDIYEKRVELINRSARRLGLSCISADTADAEIFNPQLGKFNAVICDVPCSGLGVLRRKPEIKYKKTDSLQLRALEEAQRKILDDAAGYTAPGGRIIYSTCTLRKAENEEQIKSFLDRNGTFAVQYEHTYFPHIDRTDGFYCAILVNSKR